MSQSRRSDNVTEAAHGGRRCRVLWVAMQLSVGGAEQLLVSAARAHDQDRFPIDLVYALAGRDALASELEATGLEPQCLGWSGRWDPRWIASFRRRVKEGHYDVVHFHSPFLAGILVPVIRSIPAPRRPAV